MNHVLLRLADTASKVRQLILSGGVGLIGCPGCSSCHDP